jgi:hypothetical protein
MTRLLAAVALLVAVPFASGCAQTRAEKLADKASGVGHALIHERDRVLALDAVPERSARLDHLSTLRLELSAANISRAAAPRLLEPQDVETAYDVLDEVYSTIDWNIPLAPGDAASKPFPALFGPAGLNFEGLRARPRAQP